MKYQIFLLWLCQILFILRVVGQAIVFFFSPSWLPPMEEWQSGLLPYHILLSTQILIICLMTKISYDNTLKAGFFYVKKPATKKSLTVISIIYFLIMLIRYIITLVIFRPFLFELNKLM